MSIARRTTVGLWTAAVLTLTFFALQVSAQLPADLPPRDTTPGEICGTGQDRLRQLGIRPLAPATDGNGLSYRQDPPLLFGDYVGPVALRDFLVAGDVPTIRFKVAIDDSEVETWQRSATRQVSGRLVSVFEPSWPVGTLDRVLIGTRWGWDQMGLYWGELLAEGVEPGSGSSVYLRMAPTNLPRVQVRALTPNVQYRVTP